MFLQPEWVVLNCFFVRHVAYSLSMCMLHPSGDSFDEGLSTEISISQFLPNQDLVLYVDFIMLCTMFLTDLFSQQENCRDDYPGMCPKFVVPRDAYFDVATFSKSVLVLTTYGKFLKDR